MALKPIYHCHDFVTGNYLATLPMNGVKFGAGLNTSGAFSGSVPLVISDPEIAALDPWDVTVPGKCVVVVDVGGSPIEAYLIFTRNRKMDPQGISITGKSIYAWLTKRLQATDYSNPPYSGISPTSPMTYWTAGGLSSYAGADPTLIAAQLLYDAMANYFYNTVTTGMNVLGGVEILINGKTPNASTPVTPQADWVAPTFPYSSLQTLDTIAQQLVGLGWQTGFDITFRVEYSNGPRSPLVATIDIAYPRAGRTVAANGVVVDMNQARNYSVDEDFGPTGTVQYEQGGQNQMFVADNTEPRIEGWPLTEVVQSRSTMVGPNILPTLQSAGEQDEFLYSYPVTTITATMPLWGTDPSLGDVTMGDDCRLLYAPLAVRLAQGKGDYNFPAGLDMEMRIVAWNATVADEGDSTVDYTLNAPPAMTASGPVLTQ